jgi:hypothetical protein
MGTQIVAHTTADSSTSFGANGKVGWYIGPSLEHYQCWKCYFQDTLHERDVFKVDFFPEKILNSLATTISNKVRKTCFTSYKAPMLPLSITHSPLVHPSSMPMRKWPISFVAQSNLLQSQLSLLRWKPPLRQWYLLLLTGIPPDYL